MLNKTVQQTLQQLTDGHMEKALQRLKNNLAKQKVQNMNESTWTRKLCAEMEAQGAFVYSAVGSAMQRAGMPDRFVAFRVSDTETFQGWLEFKGEHTKVRPLQYAVMREMHLRGVNVFIVRYGSAGALPTISDIYSAPLLHFDNTGYGLMAALLRCGKLTV